MLIIRRHSDHDYEVLYGVNGAKGDDPHPNWRILRPYSSGITLAAVRGDLLLMRDERRGVCWYYDFCECRFCELEMEPATHDDVARGIRWYVPDHKELRCEDWEQWANYDGRAERNRILVRDAAEKSLRYFVEARDGHPEGCRRYYLGKVADGLALVPLDGFPEAEWRYVPAGCGGVLLREGSLLPGDDRCEAAIYTWKDGQHRWVRVSHGNAPPFRPHAVGMRRAWEICVLGSVVVVVNSEEGTIYLYDVAEKLRAALNVPPTSGKYVPKLVYHDRLRTCWYPSPDIYDEDVSYKRELREYDVPWHDWYSYEKPDGR